MIDYCIIIYDAMFRAALRQSRTQIIALTLQQPAMQSLFVLIKTKQACQLHQFAP